MYTGAYPYFDSPSTYHGTLSVVTQPSTEPVSLADLKAHLRVDIVADDPLITSLGIAARDYVERITRRTCVYTGYQLLLDTFPGFAIHLPRLPVAVQPSGTVFGFQTPQIQYVDINGDTQTLSSPTNFLYDLTHNPPRLALPPMVYWPWTQIALVNAVKINFVAGYGPDGSTTPELLKTAIKMLTAHWYNNREAVGNAGSEIPLAVESIMKIYNSGDYR